MISYLKYFNPFNTEKVNWEVASYILKILVENEDALFSNFNRSKLTLQIPISTYFCDNLILKFLAQIRLSMLVHVQ